MTINDCFRAQSDMISLDEALAHIAKNVQPVCQIETVAATKAQNLILAEEVAAPLTQPPFASSAMDGFATRASDLFLDGPTTMDVVARIAAGHPYKGEIPRGCAVEIFTGAPVPDGLDVVAMVEDCTVETVGDKRRVTLPKGLRSGNFVRPAGEDFSQGDVILQSGYRLRPQHLSLAAAVGRSELRCYKPLRIGIFSTGDEIIEPGNPLAEGQIYGSNRYGQMALARSFGFDVHDLGHLPDDPKVIAAALEKAGNGDFDAIVTSGGVSMGGEDHVRQVVQDLGELHLWKIAVKPGKPVALGRVGKAAFVGLPGYPVSALVTMMVVGRPLLMRLAGAVNEPIMPIAFPVPLGFDFSKKHNRRQFLRATIQNDPATGQIKAISYRTQESTALTSLTQTDGLLDIGADCKKINAGELVPFLPFSGFLA